MLTKIFMVVTVLTLSSCSKSDNQIENSNTNTTSDGDQISEQQVTKLELTGIKKSFAAGDQIHINATLLTDKIYANEDLTLLGATGAIALEMSIGAHKREASCIVEAAPTTIDCTYIIQAGDSGSLSINSVWVSSTRGNTKIAIPPELSKDQSFNIHVQESRLAPRITSIELTSLQSAYTQGDQLHFHVIFSDIIHLKGSATLIFSLGDIDREANCKASKKALDCRYTVQKGDSRGIIKLGALVSSSLAGDSAHPAILEIDKSIHAKFFNDIVINPKPSASLVSAPHVNSIAVSGNEDQIGIVGTTLEQRFIATVYDEQGKPTAGIPVSWIIASGGGHFEQSELASISDENGQAFSPRFTLGNVAGQSIVVASIGSQEEEEATFIVTSLAGAADSIEVYANSGQSAPMATTLSHPFIALVKDARGNPVPDATVVWKIFTAGGSLSVNSTTTLPDGTTIGPILTLAPGAGTNKVAASIESSDHDKAVIFTAKGLAESAPSITVKR